MLLLLFFCIIFSLKFIKILTKNDISDIEGGVKTENLSQPSLWECMHRKIDKTYQCTKEEVLL